MLDKYVAEHLILGIDPGTTYMGYALLHTAGSRVSIVTYDVLDMHKLDSHYEKLQRIFFKVQELIDLYHPTELAIETQFVDKNVQTMLKLAHGQGVAIAAALSRDLAINEYTPMKIKMAVTGNGHASKEQVAGMLQRYLHIAPEDMPKKLDATDALGIAYCHYLQLGLPISAGSKCKTWADFAKNNANRVKK
ncbi:MAG: crossover junction endodeoxyribonuclease RuvC [Paludibacteraceae bacterium]|nr:crossover junction endodeoxyribonuclease RuvC [Paludibacteraceae bacterium]